MLEEVLKYKRSWSRYIQTNWSCKTCQVVDTEASRCKTFAWHSDGTCLYQSLLGYSSASWLQKLWRLLCNIFGPKVCKTLFGDTERFCQKIEACYQKFTSCSTMPGTSHRVSCASGRHEAHPCWSTTSRWERWIINCAHIYTCVFIYIYIYMYYNIYIYIM